MSDKKTRIHDVEGLNARLKEITRRVHVDISYLHDDRSREHVVWATREAVLVLDVGAGMRGHLDELAGRVETLDLNDFGDYPDILGDVCSPFPDWMAGRYDAVVALAILEHVYDPPAAVANFRKALRPGGELFLYVPWMWRYHAPPDLMFQDYQRLSRDGLAYLLRDFEEVTLYPIRGKYSAIVNHLKFWKPLVEGRFGTVVNRVLDWRASPWRNTVQASGFFVAARKAAKPPG